MQRYFESDLIDDIYDILFNNIKQTDFFCAAFPEAEVNREFAYIKLNDDYVIKVERL